MSAYPLKDVIKFWEIGKLTQEQVIGQILMLLQELQQQLDELERGEGRGKKGDDSPRSALNGQ